MSKEILKALMQLFALIAKQDEGIGKDSDERRFVINFLNSQLNQEAVNEYIELFDNYAGLDKEQQEGQKLTSVHDSVKIIGICKKINKTLNQEQKVIVLVRLYEMVNAHGEFTAQRMSIIQTVAKVFRLSQDEINDIREFIVKDEATDMDISSNFLVIDDKEHLFDHAKLIHTEEVDGCIVILHVKSVELYFLKYTGSEELYYNGLGLNNQNIYLFASGSTVKMPKGKPVYYSDITTHFLEDVTESKISYHCEHVTYTFPNGKVGLNDVSFSENHGKLLGIMGVSGAGKTTLLNILCGMEQPTEGRVLINGIDLHEEQEKTEGVIGLVPQDDLLIEELTVFENLYYNAKLCFKDKPEQDILELIDKTLDSLGLLEYKGLKVGSPIKKVISGGQRKRLNIALELIREPSILFVDEPTTGLSSRDSENVMDLLRELSIKGKLVFVVIHQPSSEIYKMFDNMMLLDVGGRVIYYGNPIEAVMYFKKMDAQINSDIGECPTCGNVNPELIFNIVEARVVDEFGKYTGKRKISPQKWEEYFHENIPLEEKKKECQSMPKALKIPGWIKQLRVYTSRDFLSKISNRQYIILNLLEAPVLAFILAFITRYIEDPSSSVYIFRENANIARFIFMALIVALFLGLTESAEEIYRDQKLLKREKFLNLSRSSYLVSKILILLLLSAIQAFTFVIIANSILEIRGMLFYYWFALFTTAAFANLLGLNISDSFNSVVTIYIMIPLVMIPMMILSGAMFDFDKLNRHISSVGRVPVIAELMPTKWTYEALMVNQYKNNMFERQFYEVEKKINNSDYKRVYYLPELRKHLEQCKKEYETHDTLTETRYSFGLLHNEYVKEHCITPFIDCPALENGSPDDFNLTRAAGISRYFDLLDKFYGEVFSKYNKRKQKMIGYWMKKDSEHFTRVKNQYHNDNIADIVKKVLEDNKIVEYKGHLYRKVDPVFFNPIPRNALDFRGHFYAPQKHIAGMYIDTYWFNMMVVWLFTVIMYVSLYYGWLKKLMNLSEFLKKRG